MYEITLREGKSLTKNEYEQIKNIWQDTFGDSDEYLDMFFRISLPHVNVITITDQGKIIGMLFSFPLTTSSGSVCNYLYAGAIIPSRRSEGIFSAVMEYTTTLCSNNYFYSLPELIDWYSSLGFSNIYNCLELTLSASICGATNCNAVDFNTSDCSATDCSVNDFRITDSNATKYNTVDNIIIEKCDFNMDRFIQLRASYMSTVNYEYVVFPEWYLNIVKIDKDICDDIMDLLSDGTEYYYVVGNYQDDELVIKETNIPINKFNLFYSSLRSIYGVEIIKIKLPITDQISAKGSKIIYAGQGLIPGNVWAPFSLG